VTAGVPADAERVTPYVPGGVPAGTATATSIVRSPGARRKDGAAGAALAPGASVAAASPAPIAPRRPPSR
jgi:hypothetical protein